MQEIKISDDILEHIKKSWHIVSAFDPARDPKLVKIEKSFLYIPACEDINAIKKLITAPDIDVRYLPEDWKAIDEHGLLYLPNPYVTSGPRFQEMYFWDSRWNVDALLLQGQIDTAKGIVENCFYSIDHYGGFVPTANRTYYLTRSQPPFLAPMVQSVAAYLESSERHEFLVRAEAALTKEYEGFWRKQRYTEKTGLFHYGYFTDGELGFCPEVVFGERHPVTGLSHYERLAEKLMELPAGDPLRKRFLNEQTRTLTDEAVVGDRAMRESGFDPSMHLGFYGLETHDYNPVCLNTLLEQECRIIADINDELGQPSAQKWRDEALQLKSRINEYLWDEEQGLFMAYNYAQEQKSTHPFLTSIFPLWTGLASPEQARRFQENLRLFDTGHGMATSSQTGDCQWDGYIWGFFADISFDALARQGYFDDAVRVGRDFKQTVQHVWESDGTFCEKYDHRGLDNISEVTMGYLSNVLDFSPTKAAVVILSERLGLAPMPDEHGLTEPGVKIQQATEVPANDT